MNRISNQPEDRGSLLNRKPGRETGSQPRKRSPMERIASKVHVVGHMDLNANKKRGLKTTDDYRKIASSCFDNADSFLRLACHIASSQ